jgi:hypothetical protein
MNTHIVIGTTVFFFLSVLLWIHRLRMKQRVLANEAWKNATSAVQYWITTNPDTLIYDNETGLALLEDARNAIEKCLRSGVFRDRRPYYELAQAALDHYWFRLCNEYLNYLDTLEQ